jgi:hypothetical protein
MVTFLLKRQRRAASRAPGGPRGRQRSRKRIQQVNRRFADSARDNPSLIKLVSKFQSNRSAHRRPKYQGRMTFGEPFLDDEVQKPQFPARRNPSGSQSDFGMLSPLVLRGLEGPLSSMYDVTARAIEWTFKATILSVSECQTDCTGTLSARAKKILLY